MSGQRVRKVADRIKVVVAEMLERRIKDPRLGFITVTDVRVSGDTQQATVFYTVLGGPDEIDGTAAALRSATGLLRSEVGKALGMRHTPTLDFILDAVPENARYIEDLLAKARASDAEVAARAAGASYAGDPDPYRTDVEDDLADDDFEDDEDDPADDSADIGSGGASPDGGAIDGAIDGAAEHESAGGGIRS
jgi:ribosome-binding factor A